MSLTSTLQDTKNRLTAMLAFANNKTGADDSNIGDAIKTLCDGYGSGGGGVRKVIVDIVPDSDLLITASATLTAQTGVDEIPDLIMMYCPDMAEWISDHSSNLPTTSTIQSGLWFKIPIPYKQWLSSANRGPVDGEFSFSSSSVLSETLDGVGFGVNTAPSYSMSTVCPQYTNKIEAGVVKVPYGGNNRYVRAGLTYRFICLYGNN